MLLSGIHYLISNGMPDKSTRAWHSTDIKVSHIKLGSLFLRISVTFKKLEIPDLKGLGDLWGLSFKLSFSYKIRFVVFPNLPDKKHRDLWLALSRNLVFLFCHSRMLLSGIHFSRAYGSPIKTFGHDTVQPLKFLI